MIFTCRGALLARRSVKALLENGVRINTIRGVTRNIHKILVVNIFIDSHGRFESNHAVGNARSTSKLRQDRL